MIAMVALGATVVPPLLDAAEDVGGARVESEHDPTRCRVLHDHTACTQLARSFARSDPTRHTTRPSDRIVAPGGLHDAMVPPPRTHAPSPSPRGPPVPIT